MDRDGLPDIVGRTASGGVVASFQDPHEVPQAAPAATFGAVEPLTDYPVPAGQLVFGDVDSDDLPDLVVESAGRVFAGLSSAPLDEDDTADDGTEPPLADTLHTYAPLTEWATTTGQPKAFAIDLDGSGNTDLVTVSQDGKVRWNETVEGGMNSSVEIGSVPAALPTSAADLNADGLDDIVTHNPQDANVHVQLSRAQQQSLDPAEEWAPTADGIYEDDPEARTTGSGPVATAATNRNAPLVGSQDEGIIPFGTDAEIDPALTRIRQAGGTFVRLQVDWGRLETAPATPGASGTYQLGSKGDAGTLMHALKLIKDKQLKFYLTLTGDRIGGKCTPEFAGRRGCAGASGKLNTYGAWTAGTVKEGAVKREGPPRAAFAKFAGAVAQAINDDTELRPFLLGFGIWNEPNNPDYFAAPISRENRPGTRKYDSRNVVPREYAKLYRDADKAITDINPAFKTFIGELAAETITATLRGPAGARATRLGVYPAGVFLRAVVRQGCKTGAPLRTDGVAWHPYNHVNPPKGKPLYRDGPGNQWGVNHLKRILDRIDTLAKGACNLKTRGNGTPNLYLTELGYYNTPSGGSSRKWHTEQKSTHDGKRDPGKAAMFEQALNQALNQIAKRKRIPWLVAFHATEIEPPANAAAGFSTDYGLFSRKAWIAGTRTYGRDVDFAYRPSRWPPPQSDWDSEAIPRLTYCTIRTWVQDQRGVPPLSGPPETGALMGPGDAYKNPPLFDGDGPGQTPAFRRQALVNAGCR